ncbi:chitin elicitor receptor kinase 1 [Sorghum bicolor]|uniref:chitin elicitor receptor kinase 1 n=1 Tax=Sorghum bicolor TaxID=4558 RepID=UPI000B4248FE|nr:chitin elicitor receptor kinase 1 [Sorghum bicolor]|eukprot:XP_021321049.1 chitin elicitor receptor kinase 1 [Sorghum bicolor]
MAPPRVLMRLLLLAAAASAAAAAGGGCDLALGSYLISRNENLTYIASLFGISDYKTLAPYNPGNTNLDFIAAGKSVNVYFRCDSLALPRAPFSTYLAASLPYKVASGDTYTSVAGHFNNLTTSDWLAETNTYPSTNIPDTGTVNVTVNCSCGDPNISPDYGLFLTYPLDGQTLTAVAANYSFNSQSQLDLLRKYNPGMDTATSGLVFIPVKDPNGSYRPLKSPGNGVSVGAIVGGVLGGVAVLVLVVLLYTMFYRRRKANKAALLPSSEYSTQLATTSMDKSALSTNQADSASGVPGITVDKSVEFSYEELFNATEGFSMSNKIGQGGFGAVYYAELRGEKAAIKKMDMQASHEFLAELKVLTHVHHLNLVRLIGFCTESSLFLVYEFIENGNLSQHLRGTGYEPLSWAARVQIALDSARGLEYIHEHTVPVYIHRDIKSANILIDKNYRAKVADFGLTKLTQVGNTSLPTRGIVGTFGYMPPEYARYGDVSPKVDVYAFGVVLYELISAKDAIVRSTESSSDSKGLVYLFEEALNTPDPKEGLQRLIDPALGEDYPMDSILKMTVLARACTQEDPKARPTMRSIVVALMTLSSTSEFWDMNAIQENQGLVNLMSGR